jgi:hypothetical protein
MSGRVNDEGQGLDYAIEKKVGGKAREEAPTLLHKWPKANDRANLPTV